MPKQIVDHSIFAGLSVNGNQANVLAEIDGCLPEVARHLTGESTFPQGFFLWNFVGLFFWEGVKITLILGLLVLPGRQDLLKALELFFLAFE